MSEPTESTTNNELNSKVSVIFVPEEMAERVADYVSELAQEDEDEVSGYMLNLGTSTVRSGGVLRFKATGDCSWTHSTDGKIYLDCPDVGSST